MTFQELKDNRIIPEKITQKAFLTACKECGITVGDIKTRKFTQEEITRIYINRNIAGIVASENAKVAHDSVISVYDNMIANYTNLYNNVKSNNNLSAKDKKALAELIGELKADRKQYESVKKGLNIGKDSFGYDANVLNGIEKFANEKLTGKMEEQDKELAEVYKELNALTAESAKYKTKFKKLGVSVKISRVQKRIEKLQAKKGKLNAKQQKIVNKATERYVTIKQRELIDYNRKLAKEREYTERRIQNNEDIKNYNNDINLTSQEITRLRSEGGIKNNLNAFGLSVEKRVMESRLARLEREKKRIDRLKNKKGFVNLTQQIVKPVQMAHGMA